MITVNRGTITKAQRDAHYAMPSEATPDNASTTYSNGSPMKPGDVVRFGDNGDAGRAIWRGPGKWEPVPCR